MEQDKKQKRRIGAFTDSFYIFLWFDDIIDGPLGNFIYGFNDGD